MKPMQKKITITCLASFLAFALINCGGKKEQTTSDKVLEFANQLVKVIDEFEVARSKVLSVINESATNMEKYLAGNLSTKDKADSYEKDWKKLATEVKTMESNFNAIHRSSRAYFNQLYSLNESISSDELRKKEQEKNMVLRKRWDKVYSKADTEVKKIRKVLQEGNDFHKVLLASVMRAKIADNISQMKDISSRARKILTELSRFSIEGKRILKGDFSGYKAENNNNNTNQGNSAEQPEPKNPTNNPTNNDLPLTEVLSNEISASSHLAAEGFVYKPSNVNDGNLKTWWSPKRDDLGTNWLQVSFDKPEDIRAIEIHGGSHYPDFPKYGNIYKMNHRVKTAVLEFSDGSTETIDLKDIDGIQEFKFTPRNTKFVILKIKTWYPSEKWKDLCISHFKVFE